MRERIGGIGVLHCGVLDRDILRLAEEAPLVRAQEALAQGLHESPDRLRTTLQDAITRMEACADVDVVALGFGLCSRGIERVYTARCRLVVPRAHDCITLLLGSKERYAACMARHPGTYWYSPGWIATGTQPSAARRAQAYAAYRERFDEEDAAYLMEAEQGWLRTYNRATYIDTGSPDAAADRAYTCRCAEELGWAVDDVPGDLSLLRDLLSGAWDEERFLVLQPGQTARYVNDARVIDAASD